MQSRPVLGSLADVEDLVLELKRVFHARFSCTVLLLAHY